jgi:undecaprenyl diphosphate synthase
MNYSPNQSREITDSRFGHQLFFRWEISHAAKGIAHDVMAGKLQENDIDENTFASYLTTAGIPDPDLLIRTGGELRISNYLLWQIAYSELYFTNTPWPAFKKEAFYEAIVNYQSRERRFGMTSEQIKENVVE